MITLSVDEQGCEDGYYGKPPNPPTFAKALYMTGYWNGCQIRADEERRMEILGEVWAEEDRQSAASERQP